MFRWGNGTKASSLSWMGVGATHGRASGGARMNFCDEARPPGVRPAEGAAGQRRDPLTTRQRAERGGTTRARGGGPPSGGSGAKRSDRSEDKGPTAPRGVTTSVASGLGRASVLRAQRALASEASGLDTLIHK